jgi:hypothetical protein
VSRTRRPPEPPGRHALETLGRTPYHSPGALMEQPLGTGNAWDAFYPFRAAFQGSDARRRLAWLLESFVYTDLESLSPESRIGLFRILEELVPAITRRRWWVELRSVLPVVIKQVSRKSPLADRKRLEPSLRNLVEKWPKRFPAATLTRPGDPLALLIRAQGVVREAVECIAAGGAFSLGHGYETLVELGDRYPETGAPSRARVMGPAGIAVSLDVRPNTVHPGKLSEIIHATLPDALAVAALTLLSETPRELLGRCSYEDGTACGRVFVKRGPQKWCREHQKVVRGQQLKNASERFQKKRRRRLRNRRSQPR